MTVSEYVLGLRERLQDRHTRTGTRITAFTEDGIRWSASELLKICNTSLEEAARLIISTTRLQEGYIKSFMIYPDATVGMTSNISTEALPSTMFKIISVMSSDNAIKYDEIQPEEANSYRGNMASRLGGYFFTVMLKETTGVVNRHLYIYVPTDVTVSSLKVTYVYLKTPYTTSDGSAIIPIKMSDRFLLDIAEMEAREREGWYNRARILESRIMRNLGLQIEEK